MEIVANVRMIKAIKKLKEKQYYEASFEMLNPAKKT
jgi:hypothetical protein